MQWQASLTDHPTYNELILDVHEFGVNLYMVLIRPDVLSMHDAWFARVEDARAAALEEFGVAEDAWQPRAAPPRTTLADVRPPAADPAPPAAAAADAELIAEVRALLADGKIIAAVALYRRSTGAGLFDAMRAVDAMRW